MNTATFTTQASVTPAAAGLSLHGACSGAGPAQQLEQAILELLATGRLSLWVDCRHLTYLSWHAQRAIYNAHQHARLAGHLLLWCGLQPEVLGQLANTGLHLLLELRSAAEYGGPAALLTAV